MASTAWRAAPGGRRAFGHAVGFGTRFRHRIAREAPALLSHRPSGDDGTFDGNVSVAPLRPRGEGAACHGSRSRASGPLDVANARLPPATAWGGGLGGIRGLTRGLSCGFCGDDPDGGPVQAHRLGHPRRERVALRGHRDEAGRRAETDRAAASTHVQQPRRRRAAAGGRRDRRRGPRRVDRRDGDDPFGRLVHRLVRVHQHDRLV